VVGGGDEELLFESGEDKFSKDWLNDGKSIIFINLTHVNFCRLPLAGERKSVTLLKSEFDKDEPHTSPDGHWIAYNSIESGRWEIYVAEFPTFTEKRRVSNGGGCQAFWRKDGKELFYLTLDGKMMAADVKGGNVLQTGAPQMLFQSTVIVSPTKRQYCVTRDGKRFILNQPVNASGSPFTVVLNWEADLRR